MTKEKQGSLIITCPTCRGLGVDNDSQCFDCQGLGVGFWLAGNFVYFQRNYSLFSFFQERLEEKVRLFINFFFFFFGFLGLVVLLSMVYKFARLGAPPWQIINTKSFPMPLLWLSLVADMYLVYRLAKESQRQQKVHPWSYQEEASIADRPKFTWQEIKDLPVQQKINAALALNAKARNILQSAWLLAFKTEAELMQPVHLLASCLKDNEIALVFSRLGVDFKILVKKIRRLLSHQPQGGPPLLSIESKRVFLLAYLEAYNSRQSAVSPLEILIALGRVTSQTKELLYELEIDEIKLRQVVAWLRIHQQLLERRKKFRAKSKFKPKGPVNRAYTSLATPFLDQVSQDLTMLARAGLLLPIVGREKEIEEIFRILETKKQGVILVGNPGTGRLAIIEGLAQRMVEESVPPVLQDKRLVSVSISALIAGADSAGAIEGRLLRVLTEVVRAGNIVLFFENIQNMVGLGAGSGETLDLAESLSEILKKGGFLTLATTTIKDYARYIDNSSLGEVLTRVDIEEVSGDEAVRILESKIPFIEGRAQVYFSYPALEEIVSLSQKFIHDRFMPEKAIKLAEEAAQLVRRTKGKKGIVKRDDVAQLVAEKTNIPVNEITLQESAKLEKLEELIHRRIVNQQRAVEAITQALRRARANLRDIKRPIANLLFLGPTGVGKTEVSKTLAEVYFGSEERMVRLDMSEYQGSNAVERLIGSSVNQIPGQLTEAVRLKPFTLVLLDEFEKAHSEVHNLFLQVFEDGRLTDHLNRTIDFTNTIIIGTSNAGSLFIQESIRRGQAIEAIEQQLINIELKKFFKPELINRFDDIIVFRPLTQTEIEQIALLILQQLTASLEERGVEFSVEPAAVKELAQAGFDPALGARPLRRLIESRVGTKLANLIIAKQLNRRDKVTLKAGCDLDVVRAQEI